MERDTLLSLLKSKEFEEQEIVSELVKVTGIMEQRSLIANKANEACAALRLKLRSLREELMRTNASDPELVRLIDDEKKNLDRKSKQQIELDGDLSKAKERVSSIQDRLAAARVEISRIEKLIEGQNLATLIKRAAAEEVAVEDAAMSNRMKDKWS